MNGGNFGVDLEGRICLFDFEEVGLLPESFASYTMAVRGVAPYLNWSRSPHLEAVSKIAQNLIIIANPTFGMSTHHI